MLPANLPPTFARGSRSSSLRRPSFLSLSLRLLLPLSLLLALPASAEWGGVGGWTPLPSDFLRSPSSNDTDGDGIPNAWELAHDLNPDVARDAWSDFDRDGVTALQEYQIHTLTGGLYGNPTGTWSSQVLPAVPWVSSASYQIVECASNGILLVQVTGYFHGATSRTTEPCLWHPPTQSWSQVPRLAGSSSRYPLVALDVNAKGEVVGYSGRYGFVWDPTMAFSRTFTVEDGGAMVSAIPRRVSDHGDVVGSIRSLSGTPFAGTLGGTRIRFSDLAANSQFYDVNDFGEFVGGAWNPYSGEMETFLAFPGWPTFFTGLPSRLMSDEAGIWSEVPTILPSEIVWEEGGTYARQGTVQDAITGETVQVHEGGGGGLLWYFPGNPALGSASPPSGWYGLPAQGGSLAALNDWGEFTGYFQMDYVEYYYDSSSGTAFFGRRFENREQSSFFYDGSYHAAGDASAVPSIFGMNDEGWVLHGPPFQLWFGPVQVPVGHVLRVPTSSSPATMRMAAASGWLYGQSSVRSRPFDLRLSQDSDGDEMPDDWEALYGLNPHDPLDGQADANGNGISNRSEFHLRRNPLAIGDAAALEIDLRPGIDSDGDGIPNVWEWRYGLNFSDGEDAGGDADGDGISNFDEYLHRTNPTQGDTDGDRLPDGLEVSIGTSPTDADTDHDGIPDGEEDQNDDGSSNYWEHDGNSDPTDPQSLPELKVMMFIAEVDRTYRASDYADPEWAYRSTHLLSTGVSALINGGAIEQEELEDWLGLSELNWPAYPPVPGVIDVTMGKQKLSRHQDFPEQPPAGWGAWDLPALEAVRGSFHFHSREVTVPDGGNGEEMSYLKYWGTHATKKVWVLLNRRLTEDLEVPFLKMATKASTLDYQNEGTWFEGAINEATKVTLGDPEVVKLTVRAGENVSETGVVLNPLEANEGTFENERRYDVDLLPVEIVELSPKVKDEDGNAIDGCEKPNIGTPLTPFEEVDPHTNKIAHREIKVKIGEALKDRKVTWTLEPLPDATPAAIRGDWEQSPTHKDRFEASTAYGANGFNRVSQTTGETNIGDDGHTAIRANVPPIGFNQVRIKIQIEGVNTPIDLIDMEVPGVVVIDPGHGGNDSGAVGRTDNTVLEKDLALAYSLKLRDELIDEFNDEERGLRIVMTRETTEGSLSLDARAQLAKTRGADVLVSIHFNSSISNSARGTEVIIEREKGEIDEDPQPPYPGDNINQNEDILLAEAMGSTTFGAVQGQDQGAVQRRMLKRGKRVTMDVNFGNTKNYHPVKACLIEVEFLSNETALNSVKFSGSTGETIKEAFAEDAAADIFNNILNQP